MEAFKKEVSTSEWKAYAYANGIKKRCRKIDNHQFELGYFSFDTPNGQMLEAARKIIKDKMLTVETARLKLCYVTHSDSGRGFTSELWEPFSGRDKTIVLEVKRNEST